MPSHPIPQVIGRRLHLVDSSAAPHQWLFRFDDGCTLNVESTWRVVADSGIVVGSADHGQLFGLRVPVDAARRCHEALGGAPVASAHYDGVTGDLTIVFADQRMLQALVNSSGYESWSLSDGRGSMLVAMGGGEVAIWRSSPEQPE